MNFICNSQRVCKEPCNKIFPYKFSNNCFKKGKQHIALWVQFQSNNPVIKNATVKYWYNYCLCREHA
jgi:hypothetical protein